MTGPCFERIKRIFGICPSPTWYQRLNRGIDFKFATVWRNASYVVGQFRLSASCTSNKADFIERHGLTCCKPVIGFWGDLCITVYGLLGMLIDYKTYMDVDLFVFHQPWQQNKSGCKLRKGNTLKRRAVRNVTLLLYSPSSLGFITPVRPFFFFRVIVTHKLNRISPDCSFSLWIF